MHFFNGISAPPVPLSDMEVYGFSEYWFSADDVLGGYNISEFNF
jgi:Golgi nucleoside diphosphatase